VSHTKFQICSTALLMVGANPISDFDGETTESTTAGQFWDTTVENWLSLYDWRFAMVMEQLSMLEAVPLAGWSHAYQVPAAILKLRRVHSGDQNITFTRYQDKLYCNYSNTQAVYVDYTYLIDTAYWPPYFRSLIEFELAAKFAFTLGAQLKLSATWSSERDRQFKLAKTIDAQSKTAGAINTRHASSLIARR
jgi:hypothetical protein